MSRSLLLEIAHCPNLAACLATPTQRHPCRSVIAEQHGVAATRHQLPEPWSGDLERAPILFFSSNPSISEHEEYPDVTWTDEQVVDFFANRYGGGRKTWMANGTHVLQTDGTRPNRANAFLASVRKTAERLLHRSPRPGVDYVVTEVVHCKSKQERGVADALHECTNRYLARILAASGAKVVVVLGNVANEAFGARPIGLHGPIELGARSRLLISLPHPNARRERRVDRILSASDMLRIERTLL